MSNIKEAYALAIGCVLGLTIGVTGAAWIYDEGRWSTESICTMDGDQAREFARQCKAGGGEIRIHEYTCEKE